MSKRYTVTSVPTTSGPEYVIHDNLTGADVGYFDCEKWAESWAEVFEEQDKEGKYGFKRRVGKKRCK